MSKAYAGDFSDAPYKEKTRAAFKISLLTWSDNVEHDY
jgi:hypothetical protein